MNFFDMLLMSRKMTFEEGKITLYGQEILIFPYLPLMEHVAQIGNDVKSIKNMYLLAKDSMLENKEGIIKSYKTAGNVNWICETINLLGHGKIKYEDPPTGPTGMIILENSTLAKDLIGKVNNPVDYILRGIIAGIISAILDKDVDAVETECCANGSDNCKIFVDLKEKLVNKFPVLCEQQV
jgi:hypothetical protein